MIRERDHILRPSDIIEGVEIDYSLKADKFLIWGVCLRKISLWKFVGSPLKEGIVRLEVDKNKYQSYPTFSKKLSWKRQKSKKIINFLNAMFHSQINLNYQWPMIDFQDRWDKIITLGSRAESRTPNPIFNIAPNEVIWGGKAPLTVV